MKAYAYIISGFVDPAYNGLEWQPSDVISHQLYESEEQARKAGEMRAPVQGRAWARAHEVEERKVSTYVDIHEFVLP